MSCLAAPYLVFDSRFVDAKTIDLMRPFVFIPAPHFVDTLSQSYCKNGLVKDCQGVCNRCFSWLNTIDVVTSR